LWLPVTITAPSVPSVKAAKYSIGVGPRPTEVTAIPLATSPLISASCSIGEDSLPSQPTATRVPPLSATIEPKVRPIANASASVRVSPTMPRMSYSRSELA
jgi:hypothetical protein